MKRTKTLALLLLLAAAAVINTGCGTPAHEWYKERGWTPDSVNYGNYRNRQMRQETHEFGVSWSLK